MTAPTTVEAVIVMSQGQSSVLFAAFGDEVSSAEAGEEDDAGA